MSLRRCALEQAEAINRLEGVERGSNHRDLDEMWIRGDLTTDKVVAEVLRRYDNKVF